MDVKGPGGPKPPVGPQGTTEPLKTGVQKTELDTTQKVQQSIDKAAQHMEQSRLTGAQTGQSNVLQLQQRLLSDHGARTEFAANPGKFLDAMGVKLPANLKAPASIPLDQINNHLDTVQNALQKQNIGLANVPKDPAGLTKFIENNLAVSLKNLPQVINQQMPGSRGGTVETAAVVAAAVVAAVVAVPVAVFGKTAPGGEVINPAEIAIQGGEQERF